MKRDERLMSYGLWLAVFWIKSSRQASRYSETGYLRDRGDPGDVRGSDAQGARDGRAVAVHWERNGRPSAFSAGVDGSRLGAICQRRTAPAWEYMSEENSRSREQQRNNQ